MNYLGVTLTFISSFFYVFVKTSVKGIDVKTVEIDMDNKIIEEQPKDFFERLNPRVKRILGISLALFSGLMYGLNYAPILYVTDNYVGASQNGLDYVFSFYTGTMMSGISFFMIYAIIRRNKPVVYPQAILPGFVSGLMWGVANCCYLLATTSLSQSVCYPIQASGPPMVGSLHGIFIFREIRGKRNIVILCIGFAFTLVGGILCGVSR